VKRKKPTVILRLLVYKGNGAFRRKVVFSLYARVSSIKKKQTALTFRRIDVNAGPVQGLVVVPVVVPDDRAHSVHGQHHGQPHPGPLGPQSALERGVTVTEQETVAHAGHVQHAFGQHEAHVEEHVGHRHERYGGQCHAQCHGSGLQQSFSFF